MTNNKIIKTIDTLGTIDKQIKELEATARKLKEELIKRGVGTFEGNLFQVSVQHFDQEVISSTLVRKLADEDFIKSVTEIRAQDRVVVKPLTLGA
jgi:hypothetical protein